MDKKDKLFEDLKELEFQIKELNFKLNNDKKNYKSYTIPIKVFKLKREIKLKEIQIQKIEEKIKKIKKTKV